jgi:tetratricopeptide (TPR) repeat protein
MNWVRSGFLSFVGVIVASAQAGPGLEWNERGVQAAARGDYAEARKSYVRALAVWRSLGPAYDAHAATTLINLGQAICGQGEWKESIRFFEEALLLNRRALGPKHIRTVINLNVLGNVNMLVGDSDHAADVYSAALAIERELYPGDIQLAHTLSGLAALRTRARKPEEALPLADEALAIAVRTAGDGSEEAGSMYALAAMAHRSAGRPERALPLFAKARAIRERAGRSALDDRYALLLSEEGLAYMDDGQFGRAEHDMKRAAELLARCSGCNFQLAVVQTNLGLLRFEQGKYAEADAVLSRALDLEQQYSVRPGPDMFGTLEALSRVRQKERRYAEAAELKKRADAIQMYR